MYKLLLVSDQEEVLNAFASISNWELLGFKPPHIRHDFEGTKDSLAKHHADGISLAVSPEQEELILAYLQENFPNVSIFQAGRNEEEVRKYLSELKVLLNRIHADFYNERSNTRDVLQMCRHEFFKKVINGMYMAVNGGGSAGGTAVSARIPGLDVCGKTGTAQNPHGKDNSVFICFAPKDNPKIAVAAYVENAGFGATWALPVASLMLEKYINGEISSERKYLEDRLLTTRFF